MPVQTLRDWLNQRNPHYTVKDGIPPSTTTTLDVVVDGWEEWLDLRESNINNLLGGLLDAEYQFPEAPQPLHAAHRFIGNEDALKFAAISWNVYIVNTALRTVAEALGRRHLLWSAGGAARAVADRFPDWSAVLATDTGFMRGSHVAGETKMFGSGFPARSDLLAADPAGLARARKCLEQVLGYALGENTRYAYILTPFEVVFVRGKLDAGAPVALAQSRGLRSIRWRHHYHHQAEHYHHPAEHHHLLDAALSSPVGPGYAQPRRPRPSTTTPSRLPVATTPTPWSSPSSSHAAPTTPPHHVAPASSPPSAPSPVHTPSPATGRAARPGRPQVAVVAWNAAGLSANLAMFVVHWLAAIDKSCAPAYPPIDEDDAYRGAGGEDASGVES
ncbi:uncharacterized protein LTHEOB_11345 [Neofusicoccum parvum]|nr:uncharacterized protein LTHEOB_11345 [Neofusicoccum parvum]